MPKVEEVRVSSAEEAAALASDKLMDAAKNGEHLIVALPEQNVDTLETRLHIVCSCTKDWILPDATDRNAAARIADVHVAELERMIEAGEDTWAPLRARVDQLERERPELFAGPTPSNVRGKFDGYL